MDIALTFRNRCAEVFGEDYLQTDAGIDAFNMGLECLEHGGTVVQGCFKGHPCMTIVQNGNNVTVAVDWFAGQVKPVKIKQSHDRFRQLNAVR